jgi:transposase
MPLFYKSKKFKSNITKWNNLGLTIFYLPFYSPHLNIIETLWRFMKYVWIDYRAYLSIDNLRSYIKNIFFIIELILVVGLVFNLFRGLFQLYNFFFC